MSHEELMEKIIHALKEGARLERVKIQFLRGNAKFIVVRKSSKVEIVVDVVLLLENVKSDTLFIFELKSGSKEKKAHKQLVAYSSLILASKEDIAMSEMIRFSRICSCWISEKENRIVIISEGKEQSLSEFFEFPFMFLLQ